MILGKHIGSIRIIWTVFGIYNIPTQLWVSRDLDKQGNYDLEQESPEEALSHCW